jgi:hypothetical protein
MSKVPDRNEGLLVGAMAVARVRVRVIVRTSGRKAMIEGRSFMAMVVEGDLVGW